MKLNEQHYMAIQMTLQGASRKEIASKLGVTGHTIYHWGLDADYQAEITRLREELAVQVKETVAAGLRDHVPNALAQVVVLSQGGQSEKVRLSASQDILDRAGFGAIQKQHKVVEITFPPGTLELAQKVMAELNARTIESVPPGERAEAPVFLQ